MSKVTEKGGGLRMLYLCNRVRKKWKKQIIESAYEATPGKESSFSFIDSYVKGKRIVMLGESSHGVGDYQTAKIELIRYLYKNHGFHVVVLENGFMETTLCHELLSEYSIEKKLQTACLDIYHTEEMLPLFDIEWGKGLHLTGMDVQPTYPNVSKHVQMWLQKHVDLTISEEYKELDKRFFDLDEQIRIKVKKRQKPQVEDTIRRYERFLAFFDEYINAHQDHHPRMLKAIRRGILNRIEWLQVCMKGYFSSGALRSAFMFKNLEWLIEDYYKGEKIIVWAHNYHLTKSRTISNWLMKMKPVGEALTEKYHDEVYCIGLYAGSGEMASYLRVNLGVKDLKKRYLESLFYKLYSGYLYLDLTDARESSKRMWHQRKWELLEMGKYPKRMAPQKAYDAILFINEVSGPTYLPIPNRDDKDV